MKYLDYIFKSLIIIICIIFLILLHNFTKLKYVKVMVIPDNGYNLGIIAEDVKTQFDYVEKMSEKDEKAINYHFDLKRGAK